MVLSDIFKYTKYIIYYISYDTEKLRDVPNMHQMNEIKIIGQL